MLVSQNTRSQMWTLRDDGDEVEQQFHAEINQLVPSYERFWQEYIVPQTYRVLDPKNIGLRSSPPVEAQDTADRTYASVRALTRAVALAESGEPLVPGDEFLR